MAVVYSETKKKSLNLIPTDSIQRPAPKSRSLFAREYEGVPGQLAMRVGDGDEADPRPVCWRGLLPI